MTRDFTFEKATKNTYRYQEVAAQTDGTPDEMAPDVCGAIYIGKWALPTKPQRIRVTVEEVTDS